MITKPPDTFLPPSIVQLDHTTKDEVVAAVEQAWMLEDVLMKSLVGTDTFYLNPDPLRNPLIFYLGHSAVFYINKLIRVGLLEHRINPQYEVLFERGVDPSTPAELDAAIQHIDWPDVDQVWAYRAKALEAIAHAIQSASLTLPIHPGHPFWGVMMGIEHSRIHFETSSMLIRQLDLSRVNRPPQWCYAAATVAAVDPSHIDRNRMVELSGGTVRLGKPQDDPTYGWGIDYGDKRVQVAPFAVSQSPVTNGEFLAFVQAGGYDCPEYWSPAAWAWVQQQGRRHPQFWRSPHAPTAASQAAASQAAASQATTRKQTNADTPYSPATGGYRYRAMFDELELPLDWPVEVTHYEAMAFCRWRGEGARLLTEAEWTHAVAVQERLLPSGANPADGIPYNLDVRWGSPSPVGFAEAGVRALKSTPQRDRIYDLRGNLWEWLGDPFGPLPGFSPHPLYEDYSAPFFDQQHYVMVGGSWASTGSYASPRCRNWFRPYFPQHVGFRIARDGN